MTDYTFVLTDQYVRFNRTSDIIVAVPLNASVPFPIGYTIKIRQVGVGRITVIGNSGVTVNAPFTGTSAYRGALLELIKVATNEWDLSGNIYDTVFAGAHVISETATVTETLMKDLELLLSDNLTSSEVFGSNGQLSLTDNITTSEDVTGYMPGAGDNNLLENGDTLVLEDGTSTLLQEDGT